MQIFRQDILKKKRKFLINFKIKSVFGLAKGNILISIERLITKITTMYLALSHVHIEISSFLYINLIKFANEKEF